MGTVTRPCWLERTPCSAPCLGCWLRRPDGANVTDMSGDGGAGHPQRSDTDKQLETRECKDSANKFRGLRYTRGMKGKQVRGRNEDFQLLGERSRKESAGHTVCPIGSLSLLPLRSGRLGQAPGPRLHFSTCRDPTPTGHEQRDQRDWSLPLQGCSCPAPTFPPPGVPLVFPAVVCLNFALLLGPDFTSQLPDENLHQEHHLSSHSALLG